MAHDHTHGHMAADGRRLRLAIAVVALGLVAQAVGAVLSGSLALLADSGHMASDLIGLVVALVATVVAARPASGRQTYGYRRVEVFAALVNGLLLLAVAGSVAVSAVGRLLDPATHEVLGVPMLVVGVVGGATNVVALLVLRGGASHSINMRGAYLEVLGDLLGSVAVVVASVVVLTTGFAQADSIGSLVITAMIVPRAWALLREAVRVLFGSAPGDIDLDDVRSHIAGTPGVVSAHDVHAWQITSGATVFSAHVVVERDVFCDMKVDETLDALDRCLAAHFEVEHATFQLEPADHAEHERSTHV
ncbi:cation diffusion facilitator family transporter [Frigoribacterium endophyticum]|jgi:cobalt-zinc-cadmium efflux system protein|uniref:cation diffusion facilitator family transporter n=1 Tax=Frigoribacterium endophyticum TaxID=1522176 RepID=UPI001420CB95|nr:cation diffusion facilitator family transporter [Frigoribacterium endophyticum]NII52256.1 cobalt-zinc-cadmium efflux system protein [Frigoribacterium endophyticum]